MPIHTLFKQKITQVFSLLITASLILAGCSPSLPTPQNSTPGANPALPAGEGNESAGELEEENAVVTFAASSYERSLYEPIIEAFNQQDPSVQVQFVELPEWGAEEQVEAVNYFRQLATTADTSIVYATAPEAGQYFRDLQPLLESDRSIEVEDFFPGLMEGCTDRNGRLIGVPLSAAVNVIFFQESAFKEAGLATPQPGWTWDDFQKTTEALARKVGSQPRYGFAEQGYLYGGLLAPLVEAHLIETGGEPDAQSLETSLQWYFDLVKSDAIYTMNTVDNWQTAWQDWEKLFKSEQRPVMWSGDLATQLPGVQWQFSESDPFINSALKTEGVVSFPVSSDGSMQDTSPVWVTCAGVSAGSTHPRAAWRWLNFLSRQRLVRDQSQDTYELTRIPARQSLAESSGYWDALPEKAHETVRFSLEHAWFGTQYDQAFNALSLALQNYMSGKAGFQEAIDSSLAEVQATPQPTEDSTAIVVATPRPTLSADTTVIKYFYNAYGEDAEKVKAMVETYQKEHPGVAIKFEQDFGSPPQGEDLVPYLASKYDCFVWYPLDNQENPPTDALNLNAFMQAEGAGFSEDFPSSLLDSFRVQDNLYALPAFSQPQIMIYNLTLLKERGLQPPNQDWSMDDFLQMLNAVASTDADKPAYGYLTSVYEDLLFRGQGVQAFDLTQEPPVAKFNSPEVVSAIQLQLDMQKANALLVQDDQNWPTVQTAMESGRIAFWSGQAGNENPWFGGPGQPSYEIGVVPMPSMPDSALSSPYWVSNYANFISQKSENPKVCWDWIKYLSTQPNAYNGVPARISMAESAAWEAEVGAERAEIYRAAVAQYKIEETTNYSPIGWPFYTWLSQAITSAMQGEDVLEVLDEAQKTAEDYLACVGPLDTTGQNPQDVFKQASQCARQVDPEGNWPVE